MLEPTKLLDIARVFAGMLTDSSLGKKTDLPFLKQLLPSSPSATDQDNVQVLVIGGSVCRTAKVEQASKGFSFPRYRECSQPAFATKEDFLQFVLSKILSDTTLVTINFAFPLTPVLRRNKTDGILIFGTKEHAFSGLVGEAVGEEIENYLASHLKRNVSVVLANDAICLLLAGVTKAPWDRLACGIVGTGVNFAITNGDTEAVNLESANFTDFLHSETLAAVDKKSREPGRALFEKETAGAYLYQHYNEIVRQKNPSLSRLTSTRELKEIVLRDLPGVEIAKELLGRSAGLVASQMAGIMFFKKTGVSFLMEGGFFWEDTLYADLVKKYLARMGLPYKASIFKLPESSLLGAAVLAFFPIG